MLLKRFLPILLFCMFSLGLSHQADAQIFKKKKKQSALQGFTPGEAPDPKKDQKMVSPIRKFFNQFNFQLEKGFGYFLYENELTDVAVVRNPNDTQPYIVPLGEETNTTDPVNAYSNWFNDLTPANNYRIDENAEVLRTDANPLAYKNTGGINPWTLRVSFTLKKVDREHLKTTGERVMTDQDFLRIGGGISFGSLKFKKDVNTQDVNELLGDYPLQQTKISTTKMFGSLTFNAYSFADFSILPDVQGGVWKTTSSDLNQDLVTYDPFFNVGVIFEKTVSKYFKLYFRPAVEMRKYTLANDYVTAGHSLTLFSVDFGALIKYPTYPRNRHGASRVQMEHVFNGRIYRGRSIFQPQNPRTGQFGQSRKERVKYGKGND